VLLELARLRSAATSARREERLTPERAQAILAPLESAHRQLPALTGVYRLSAETLLRSAAAPTEAQLAMLRAAPRDAGLRSVTVELYQANGHPDEAAALAKEGLLFAPAAERFPGAKAE
jgi:hypothetical protein